VEADRDSAGQLIPIVSVPLHDMQLQCVPSCSVLANGTAEVPFKQPTTEHWFLRFFLLYGQEIMTLVFAWVAVRKAILPEVLMESSPSYYEGSSSMGGSWQRLSRLWNSCSPFGQYDRKGSGGGPHFGGGSAVGVGVCG